MLGLDLEEFGVLRARSLAPNWARFGGSVQISFV